ncbi:MAG: MBOAT family protein [Planctomycetaceae bacterium]|nr:MBOAT family protein [Planctomycetaceae bacterium]
MKLWIFALVLIGVLAETSSLSPHVKMMVIAVSVFAVLKGKTLCEFLADGHTLSKTHKLLWFVGWPGFDIQGFFIREHEVQPNRSEWKVGLLNTSAGLILWVAVAPYVQPYYEIVAGWIAMTGIVLTLHFGLLHLCTLFWIAKGRDVTPLMNAPILSESLSEFWGKRWNIAFRDFAYARVFKPISHRWNATTATWASFAFSGLVHELAITVPAGGGYGLPLLYFLLQGSGVGLERRLSRRGWAVRRGLKGWMFAALFLIPAAPLLFPPPFVRNVILPLIPNFN